MVPLLTSQGPAKDVASKIPPLCGEEELKESRNEARRVDAEELLQVLGPVVVDPVRISRSGMLFARKNSEEARHAGAESRSGFRSHEVVEVMAGEPHIRFRPVSVSRNLRRAPNVDDPVAMIRTRGSGRRRSSASATDSEADGSHRARPLPAVVAEEALWILEVRRTRGSSQSKYSTSDKDWLRTVFPVRRTPASHTTRRSCQAFSTRSTHEPRATIRRHLSV